MKKIKLLSLFFLAISPMVVSSCAGDTPVDESTSSQSEVNPNLRVKITLNPCNGDTQYLKDNIISSEPYVIKKLPTEGPTMEGDYKFAGWSTKFDKTTGMGSKAYKVQNNQVSVKDKNINLYAVYARVGLNEEQSQAELDKWIAMSQPNHLYYHYYRFQNNVAAYDDWDVWAWPYKPDSGEGAKFDWNGRSQQAYPNIQAKADGDATVDQYAGAYIDIDLTQTYNGGWTGKPTNKIGGSQVSFEGATQIGLQIVKTSTRTGGGQFWTNDGSNLYIKLEDYAVDVTGGKAYHVFVVQDSVQDPTDRPTGEKDPFDGDDGNNTTYGSNTYNNVNWDRKADKVATSADFSKVGVGYQIMVSSFADSDGDGFGDIYGIVQKLDYLEKLGVKALWLTPIQLSDSYHGYDITDYETVDPKFGSATSPAGVANKGKVDVDTALEDYKLLISEAHKRGMKIVMDLVLNHTSTSNSWYVRSANLDSHFRGYYQWGKTGAGIITEDNNWYQYGEHEHNYSYYAKFGSSMPELNFSYVDTRLAVEEMSIYWARDIGVDGFRLDAVKHIFMDNEVTRSSGDTIVSDIGTKDYSSNLTKNLQFFRELKQVVTDCSHKEVFFVGENFDGHAYHVAPYYEAFDSLFDFYSYFNLTSAAATGRYNTDNKYGAASGFLRNTSVYSVSADTGNSGVIDGSGIMNTANNSPWNFIGVYNTYNAYRGDTSLPGLFTSNHDIARVINRVAGDGTNKGLDYQGNITNDPAVYKSFETSADLVKIAELMLPGVTWIYYGDEIGMTGNFPSNYNPADVANIPYADLWYRQPMKWVSGGQAGDEAGTTDYYVTGSSMRVEQDLVNKNDNCVVPALTQMDQEDSEFAIMKKFIALKTADSDVGQALRTGSVAAGDWASGNSLVANVLQFSRTLNGTTVNVLINFNSVAAYRQGSGLYNLSGEVLASYNGASLTNLPPYSALVVKA